MGAHVSVPMYRRTLGQRLRLEGGRCRRCGRVFFPPLGGCRECGGSLEAVALSGRGTVRAVTRISPAGAPPEFAEQASRQGGYTVAIVELEEGPSVTAQLADVPGLLDIGDPVRAVTRRLYEEEGVIRYGFKFVPAREDTAPASARAGRKPSAGAS